jgi:hypothetical protein
MSLIRNSIVFVILGTMFLVIGTISAQVDSELPELKSGGSVNIGVPVDFDILYQRVNAIYDVVEHNNTHIIWKFRGTTDDLAFVFADGRIVVASPINFTLGTRETLENELNKVIDMINTVGGGVSEDAKWDGVKSAVYYTTNPGIYHSIIWEYKGNFDYTLIVPDCVVEEAKMIVYWGDYPYDQAYYIDGNEVTSCHGAPCEVPSADITDKIPAGVHSLSGKKIENEHIMRIEAITSPSPPKLFVLHGPEYIPWINETSTSQTLDDLYKLVNGSTT